MRTQIVVFTFAAVLLMAPAASAELRTGTAKDRVGDTQTRGIEFAQSKDLVQVDARYDRTAGDIVVDATMAGDVPSMGRHYYQSFSIELRSRGATGCDGEQRVTIFGLGSMDSGFWDRIPAAVAPGTRTSITHGYTRVQRSGRHIVFRSGFGPLQGAGLRDLDLTCVTVDVRGPTDGNGIALFLGLTIPGPLYDRLDE